MKVDQCICKFDDGRSQVVVTLPDNICRHRKNRLISIDQCIVDVIIELWKIGISTEASCCGHRGERGNPSIVLSEGSDVADIYWAYKTLQHHDPSREWDVFKWELVKQTERETKSKRRSTQLRGLQQHAQLA